MKDAATTSAAQPPANPDRGEHELTLAGVTYRLRPSRQAIRACESQTGLSLLALVRLGNAGELTSDHLGIIACQLIRAGAEDEMTRRVDPDKLADLIFEASVVSTTARLTAALCDAALGGRTASGEAKATTA
ncbi:GTA-gp10 family protein [Sphingomonas sp. IW22]|uniref:GTA-gp10 family protein n=1 Tax=Sphingomonas sp. IW22 TaxID=3242489 RepID=UPI0035229F68